MPRLPLERFCGVLDVTLLFFLVMSSLVSGGYGQNLLGTAGRSTIQYIVSYEGSIQPGGSITFINTLTNFGPGAWPNDRVSGIEIFAAFGNSTVPGKYPAYFTENATTLTLKMTIPSNLPPGNYHVVAMASLQGLSINVFYGNTWNNELPFTVQGNIPIQTSINSAISTVIADIAKYWPSLLLIYLTAVVLVIHLASKADSRRRDGLRIPFGPA